MEGKGLSTLPAHSVLALFRALCSQTFRGSREDFPKPPVLELRATSPNQSLPAAQTVLTPTLGGELLKVPAV